MIENIKYIQQKQLTNLITEREKNIVNIFDEEFQYCNGMIMVVCDFNQHSVIQKLFKVGALTNYRNLTAAKSIDLSRICCSEETIDVYKTKFIKEIGNYAAYVFKIGEQYVLYNKKFIDVFQNVNFKVDIREVNSMVPNLRVYASEKLIGLILPIREDRSEDTQSILKSIESEIII